MIKVTNLTGSRGGGRGEGGEGGEELGNKVTLEKFGQSFRQSQNYLERLRGSGKCLPSQLIRIVTVLPLSERNNSVAEVGLHKASPKGPGQQVAPRGSTCC